MVILIKTVGFLNPDSGINLGKERKASELEILEIYIHEVYCSIYGVKNKN